MTVVLNKLPQIRRHVRDTVWNSSLEGAEFLIDMLAVDQQLLGPAVDEGGAAGLDHGIFLEAMA